MVYGELGRHKLNDMVEVRMVSIWERLVNGSGYKLSSMLYKLLRILHNKGIYSSPWICKLNSIFNNTGLSYMWDITVIVRNPQSFYSNTQLFTISHLKKVIEQRLCDMYEQEWLSEVNTNRQCFNLQDI